MGIVWVPFLIMLGIGPAVSAGPPPGKRVIPWDGAALVKTPPVHPTTERPAQGMRAFFYEGAENKGKPTWVFAYYAAPEGKPPAGGWPAVVCAHGGGGTAFPAWVREWNRPHDMTPEQYREYNTKWDPSAYLPYAKMPMLWVSSFTEPVFPIDLFSKSATTAAGTSILCIRPWLIHGHGFGWEEAWEIYAFADSVVKGGPPMPRLGRPQVNPKDGLVHAKATNDLKNAALSFTTAGGAWKDRKWANIPCTLGKDEVVSSKPLPADATAFVINGNDKRDGCVNSEVIVVKP